MAMKTARLLWGLCLLYFALMAAAAALSVQRDRAALPRVALTAAWEEAPGQYRVPLAALIREEGGRDCVYLVAEEEGPWGPQYRCRREPVRPLALDPAGGTALVAGRRLDRSPVALPGGAALAEGIRVRFAPEPQEAPHPAAGDAQRSVR